jgi:hypothetical protein
MSIARNIGGEELGQGTSMTTVGVTDELSREAGGATGAVGPAR